MSCNPLKSFKFYFGCILAIVIGAGVKVNPGLLKLLIGLPGIYLLVLIVIICGLYVMSILVNGKHRQYAIADIQNFGPYIAKKIAESGHVLLGMSSVAFIHFCFISVIASDLVAGVLCLFLALALYIFSWLIVSYMDYVDSTSRRLLG